MTRAKLIDRCDRLRSHILSREWATEEEIGEWWPKKRDSLDKWTECFGHLRFFMGRAESAQNRIDSADQELLDALTETPLVTPLPQFPQLSVYPKSFNALLWFHHKDFLLSYLNDRLLACETIIMNALPEREQIEDIFTMRQLIEEEIGKQLAIVAYAATRPGTTVDQEAVEDLPDGWMELSPQEILILHKAFLDVNVRRVTLIPYLAPPQRTATSSQKKNRLSWSVFGSEMATVFKTDVADILNNRSLIALLAQTRLGSGAMGMGM